MAKTSQNCIKQYCLLVVIISLSLHPQFAHSQRSIDPEIQKKIDDFIQESFPIEDGLFGMGLTVVQNDGEILYTTGYGQANKEKDIPNGNDTQFLIASVTKSFTSIVIASTLHKMFPDLGEAVLDTPIAKLLPDTNFVLIDRFRTESVTFRDLLAHRVCLNREDITILADSMKSVDELVYRTRYNEEVCGFRTEMQYNNQLYAMAGELIAKIANSTYEELVQDFLIELGMLNTTFDHGSGDPDQLPYRAMPYYIKDNQAHPFNFELAKRFDVQKAAAGLLTTPNDMARYIRFLLNLGNLDGRQIISKEVMEWQRKPSIINPDEAYKTSDEDVVLSRFGYGLGFILASYSGWQLVEHGGSTAPYQTQLSLFPGKGLGIFSSSNMQPFPVAHFFIHAFIFETLMGNRKASEIAMKVKEQTDAKMAEKKRKEVKRFDETYQKFTDKSRKLSQPALNIVGTYGKGSTGEVGISEKFNEETNRTEYFFEHGIWFKGWLEEQANDRIFKLKWTTDFIQYYYANGEVDGNAFVAFEDDTLTLFWITPTPDSFKLDVRLELLPPIPWSPGSCGPENFYTLITPFSLKLFTN